MSSPEFLNFRLIYYSFLLFLSYDSTTAISAKGARHLKKVVIIGAGGHSKVVIDILRSHGDVEVVGSVDRSIKENVLGVKVIGDDSVLPDLFQSGVDHAFVAVGDNALRHKLFNRAVDIGFQMINAISPFSYVSESVQLGNGIVIMPGTVVNAGSSIADNVIVNTSSSIDHDCIIDKSCHIAPGSHLAGNVHVGEGTFVGIGTTIIDNIRVGKWSALGGGSVVVNPIPDRCLALGAPAKVIRRI